MRQHWLFEWLKGVGRLSRVTVILATLLFLQLPLSLREMWMCVLLLYVSPEVCGWVMEKGAEHCYRQVALDKGALVQVRHELRELEVTTLLALGAAFAALQEVDLLLVVPLACRQLHAEVTTATEDAAQTHVLTMNTGRRISGSPSNQQMHSLLTSETATEPVKAPTTKPTNSDSHTLAKEQ